MQTFSFEIKAIDKEQGLVSGWANKYNVFDRQGDILVKGALPEPATVPIFLNHDPTKTVGKGMAYEKDGQGIWIDLKLFINSESETIKERAREAFELAKEGVMKFSVGFIPKQAEWGKHKTDGKEVPARIVKGIELAEVSLVQIPANNESNIMAVKSAELSAEEILKDHEEQEEVIVIHVDGADHARFVSEVLDEEEPKEQYIYEEDPETVDQFIKHLGEHIHDFDVNVTIERPDDEQ